MAIIIVGAGGFAKEVYHYVVEAAAAAGKTAEIKGFLSASQPAADVISLAPHLGHEDQYAFSSDDEVVLAIGDSVLRARIGAALAARDVRNHTIIHPTAYVCPTAEIGEGCVVAPFCFVGSHAKIGAHTVLNIYASAGHDAEVESFCTFSPYAAVTGNVHLGEQSFLGSQAVVTPGVSIGRNTKLAAGSIAVRDAPPGSLLIGNPAKGRVMFRY